MRPHLLLAACLSTLPLNAFFIGNPAQPALLTSSLIYKISDNFSFRAAYLDDYVYGQHVQNAFNTEKPPLLRLSTDAALLTLNFFKRLDLYGIVGSSSMQMDQEVYTKREFAWGVGGKLIFMTLDSFRMGCDFKYFETNQKPLYLIQSGTPYNIVSDWHILYTEYQAAVGASYQTSLICPYVQVTYIVTKIDPHPYKYLVSVPGYSEPAESKTRCFEGIRKWGMAVGATLLAGNKSTLAVESRFFNQNGIDASLEFRF